ncbi:dolichyl-diphosphooligosaccharide--protein glycosyltransferase 48 kDa subunit-like [Helianthus annuus]|uniref:dolichyl-diphosphooligosaccharide--protein glycosyltransferase 48 kDa subunit-like n=1 Tax=Helianthus annuus TaxID=4232 RepID=UPI001652DFFA|nr:dolichyl-diphosphooligosaccharide--protein glycosyltransferase 48 kDa subunit-like [Helianthus annuus]
MDVASVLDFVDSGKDLIVAADASASDLIRSIAAECGVDFDEDPSAVVIDHGSYVVSGTEGDDTLIAADDFIKSDVLLGSTKIEVSFCLFYLKNTFVYGYFDEQYKDLKATRMAANVGDEVVDPLSMFLQWVDEFFNKVNLISAIEHKNLVKLLACSIEGPESLLVWKLTKEGVVSEAIDPLLKGEFHEHEVLEVMQIGLLCTQASAALSDAKMLG